MVIGGRLEVCNLMAVLVYLEPYLSHFEVQLTRFKKVFEIFTNHRSDLEL